MIHNYKLVTLLDELVISLNSYADIKRYLLILKKYHDDGRYNYQPLKLYFNNHYQYTIELNNLNDLILKRNETLKQQKS